MLPTDTVSEAPDDVFDILFFSDTASVIVKAKFHLLSLQARKRCVTSQKNQLQGAGTIALHYELLLWDGYRPCCSKAARSHEDE